MLGATTSRKSVGGLGDRPVCSGGGRADGIGRARCGLSWALVPRRRVASRFRFGQKGREKCFWPNGSRGLAVCPFRELRRTGERSKVRAQDKLPRAQDGVIQPLSWLQKPKPPTRRPQRPCLHMLATSHPRLPANLFQPKESLSQTFLADPSPDSPCLELRSGTTSSRWAGA